MQSLNTCKAIIQELFKVFKAHYENPNMDRACDELIAICVKYGDDKFCIDIADSMWKQLIRRHDALSKS